MTAASNKQVAFSASSQSTIESFLEKAKVPGAVITRVSSAGVVASAVFGHANLVSPQKTSQDTAFHLYSGTKLFTASALMLLVENGSLDLDGDIRPYFPECAFAHAVTPRQLASHSSGLRETLRAFLAVHFPGEPRPTTGEALARYSLAGGKKPGHKAKYRNVNFAILGELIARVANTSYEDFVCESLLKPWSSNATFRAAEAAQPATGYVRRFSLMRLFARLILGKHGATVFDKPVGSYVALRSFDLNTAAIGGLVGGAADFVPIVTEFLSDKDGVLRAETRRSMLTASSKGAAGIASTIGVGIGWKQGEASGKTFWNHEGGGPGFCTELRIYPEEDVGFVILMNLSHTRRLSWVCHSLCEELKSEGAI